MKKLFSAISFFWTFITIILFGLYGYRLYQNEAINKFYPITIFIICGLYFILSLIFYILIANSRKKVYKNDLKKIKKTFGISSKILKLIIILTPIVTITSEGFSWSLKGTKFVTVVYIIWTSFTLLFEFVKFLFRKAIQK